MRRYCILIGITAASFLPVSALCQAPVPGTSSPQMRKAWVLGEHVSRTLEDRDGRIDDPRISRYLSSVGGRLATATGRQPIGIRLTRSSDRYAALLPNSVLYRSGALLHYIQSEAELAGLIAHQMSHAGRMAASHSQQPQSPVVHSGECAAASPKLSPWANILRERERQANTEAIGFLRAAGYDPAGVLDLFSRLAYEHPAWAPAIVPEDLLFLRGEVEAGAVPESGYTIDSSSFLEMKASLAKYLGHSPGTFPTPRRTLYRRWRR
jgi:beta-barrel assembly-enhancing protease